jgi:hypothetical protein
MNCKSCDKLIPRERLEIFPLAEYCVSCADKKTPEYKGFMVFSHKTAPELIRISTKHSEAMRQAERANRRAR